MLAVPSSCGRLFGRTRTRRAYVGATALERVALRDWPQRLVAGPVRRKQYDQVARRRGSRRGLGGLATDDAPQCGFTAGSPSSLPLLIASRVALLRCDTGASRAASVTAAIAASSTRAAASAAAGT